MRMLLGFCVNLSTGNFCRVEHHPRDRDAQRRQNARISNLSGPRLREERAVDKRTYKNLIQEILDELFLQRPGSQQSV